MDPKFSHIRLTQFSHGAGCGCKISPNMLEEILKAQFVSPDSDRLIVGNQSKDDAAAYDLYNGQALIASTDFFMPIVDDAFDFGRIASANAISDIYAMGARPILALAILGWPVNQLPAEVARQVIAGSRSLCTEAGITLAGGHSIDCPEPLFGLCVNGLVDIGNIKKNNTAKNGDRLFLTKPLGVGILTTAEKKGLLQSQHQGIAAQQMMQLNQVGEAFSKIKGVTALTDVTGFGLLGHLLEMAEGSGLSARLDFAKVPLIIDQLPYYIEQGSVPGGTGRNWDSYGMKISFSNPSDQALKKAILADPQTSGGLLVAVEKSSLDELTDTLKQFGLEKCIHPIGEMVDKKTWGIQIL